MQKTPLGVSWQVIENKRTEGCARTPTWVYVVSPHTPRPARQGGGGAGAPRPPTGLGSKATKPASASEGRQGGVARRTPHQENHIGEAPAGPAARTTQGGRSRAGRAAVAASEGCHGRCQ
jgi:hypothetical protein